MPRRRNLWVIDTSGLRRGAQVVPIAGPISQSALDGQMTGGRFVITPLQDRLMCQR
jgi:hypothetical protein